MPDALARHAVDATPCLATASSRKGDQPHIHGADSGHGVWGQSRDAFGSWLIPWQRKIQDFTKLS